MIEEELWCITHAARILGYERRVVSALVNAWDIRTYPMPHCGRGRGLNLSSLKEVARKLNRELPPGFRDIVHVPEPKRRARIDEDDATIGDREGRSV